MPFERLGREFAAEALQRLGGNQATIRNLLARYGREVPRQNQEQLRQPGGRDTYDLFGISEFVWDSAGRYNQRER